MLKITAECFVVSENVRGKVETAFRDRRLSKVIPKIFHGSFGTAKERFQTQQSPQLIIIEAEKMDGLLETVDDFAAVCDPGSSLIIIGTVNDVEVYRALKDRGVTDYIVMPATPTKIADTIMSIYATPENTPVGKVIAFLGTKGGSGNSTITDNVGYDMSLIVPGDVMVVDLDIPFGSDDLSLNLEATAGIQNALAEPERIDEEFIKRFALKYDNRLHLLAAPSNLETSTGVDPDKLETVLEALRKHINYVLVDLPHGWNNWIQRVLRVADAIVLTSPLDLAALRNTKHLLDWLNQERPGDQAIYVVLNGTNSRNGHMIEPNDFIQQLGLKNSFTIPFDLTAIHEAMSAGKMLEEVAPKSKCSQAIHKIAETLIEAIAPKHVPSVRPTMGAKELFREFIKIIRGS